MIQEQHITAGDLDFMVENAMALRFQHTQFSEILATEGAIKGDAYSLSEIDKWLDLDSGHATAEKAADFEVRLKRVLESCVLELIRDDEGPGELLLLKDIQKAAESPRTDRSYHNLHTIGAGTRITTAHIAAQIPLDKEDMKDRLGYDPMVPLSPDVEERPITRVVDDLFSQFISQIRILRKQEQEKDNEHPPIWLEQALRGKRTVARVNSLLTEKPRESSWER